MTLYIFIFPFDNVFVCCHWLTHVIPSLRYVFLSQHFIDILHTVSYCILVRFRLGSSPCTTQTDKLQGTTITEQEMSTFCRHIFFVSSVLKFSVWRKLRKTFKRWLFHLAKKGRWCTYQIGGNCWRKPQETYFYDRRLGCSHFACPFYPVHFVCIEFFWGQVTVAAFSIRNQIISNVLFESFQFNFITDLAFQLSTNIYTYVRKHVIAFRMFHTFW